MEQARLHTQCGALAALLDGLQPSATGDVRQPLQRVYDAAQPLIEICDRAVDSLRQHRDVMESDVAQSLWGCHDCGYIVEKDQPDLRPQCGALGGEFEWFGPFYSVTMSDWGDGVQRKSLPSSRRVLRRWYRHWTASVMRCSDATQRQMNGA